jgi:tetratricopeptide (TPR) repeat protein
MNRIGEATALGIAVLFLAVTPLGAAGSCPPCGPPVIYSYPPATPAPRPPLVKAEGRDEDEAPGLFWRGYSYYWKRDYEAALNYVSVAVELDGGDARFWYYKGLAELNLGKDEQARRSFEEALRLHRQGRISEVEIGLALERFQGPTRALLHEALKTGRLPDSLRPRR